MDAGKTNTDPLVIASYFYHAALNIGGIPARIRGDMGTENSLVAELQTAVGSRFLYGTSQHNQRIES